MQLFFIRSQLKSSKRLFILLLSIVAKLASMSKSLVNLKITLLESIEKLNDSELIEVLDILQHEFGCKNLNELIRKIIMHTTGSICWDPDVNCLENFVQSINDIIAKRPKNTIINHTEQCSKNSKIETTRSDHNMIIPSIATTLHQDLIMAISLFLNEKDIFNFEQCCRIFYQTVNCSSYLIQCKNYKTIEITREKLDIMSSCDHDVDEKYYKYGYYKYSKALKLEFSYACSKPFDEYGIHVFRKKWSKIWKWYYDQNDHKHHDKWLFNALKSAEIVILDSYSNVSILPTPIGKQLLQTLLHPHDHQSRLKNIKLDYFWFTRSEHSQSGTEIEWDTGINDHHDQPQLILEPKKRSVLNSINHTYIPPDNLRKYNHLLRNINVDTRRIEFNYCYGMTPIFMEQIAMWHPSLTMVTLNKSSSFGLDEEDIADDSKQKAEGDNLPLNININTLRLINFQYRCSFLNDKLLIEKLNLHKSLKNLTLCVQIESSFSNHNGYQRNVHYPQLWTGIKNILTKEYFHNLTNVNLLLKISSIKDIDSNSDHDHGSTTNIVFDILQKRCNILKYQFKQLNIALVIQQKRSLAHYQLIEWNSNIDDTFLRKEKQKCDNCTSCDNDINTVGDNKKRYNTWLNQWMFDSNYT